LKWFFKNLRARSAFAVKNPRYATNAILRELAQTDERFIGRITGKSRQCVRDYLSEPISMREFATLLDVSKRRFSGLMIESADLFAKKALIQYARCARPRPAVCCRNWHRKRCFVIVFALGAS
jgi:hypothetical protein